MLTLTDVYVLGAAHFIGDFVLQSHRMSVNKSKDKRVLLQHVCVYGLVMSAASVPLFWNTSGTPAHAIVWIWANFALHFLTDYVTSRRTSRLWGENRFHDFFVTVGFDQMIHLFCLFTLLVWLR